MNMTEQNSLDYWEERFSSGDWEKFDGNLQSIFFTELAIRALPDWLKQELSRHDWTVLDLGCAQGGGTASFAKSFPSCHLIGMDFSSSAINAAREAYPFCDFDVVDLYEKVPSADVIFSSNTLEHLRQPRKIMEAMAHSAREHLILLLPLRDPTNHPEHFSVFDEEFFPLRLGDLTLSFFSEIDCAWRNSPYWPGEQILLVYSAAGEGMEDRFLSDLYSAREHALEKAHWSRKEQELEALGQRNHSLLEGIEQVKREKDGLQQEADHLRSLSAAQSADLDRQGQELDHTRNTLQSTREALEASRATLQEAQAALERSQGVQEQLQARINDLSEKARALETTQSDLLRRNQELEADKKQFLQEQTELRELLERKTAEMTAAENSLHGKERELAQARESAAEARNRLSLVVIESQELDSRLTDAEDQAQALRAAYTDTYRAMTVRTESIRLQERQIRDDAVSMLMDYANHKVFRLVHFLCRIKWQAFHRSRAERRAFWRWLFGRSRRRENTDHRYNPLFAVVDTLSRSPQLPPEIPSALPSTVLPGEKHITREEYRHYDVLIFSVIDYDFRYQRPQQIADSFARQGHRVFYINANFSDAAETTCTAKGDNLWLITLPNRLHPSVYSTDFRDGGIDLQAALAAVIEEMGIRDAVMIADYPTWIAGISYLKNRYGFLLVTDYMDDFGGFDNAETSFVERECVRLLNSSDLVVASSTYLAELAQPYNSHIRIIRNGTEYAHFHAAFGRKSAEGKKVIGYYGAIAHWFDFGKIESLSRRFPAAEIRLIGSVTAGEDRLRALPNVQLLGEMPYSDLPDHLAEFDVCLIPFETTTNLIKATNPVKFYEYLSAGKKIVATEIPELEEYRDRYVYLSNDDREFADYVELCLNGTDTLSEAEECMAFAEKNDWMHRVSQFKQEAEALFPSVSIVVLCYNQLSYTKQCIDSILRNTAYPNYEIILVDNNSADATPEWIRQMADTSERIKAVLNTENKGFAGGNNDGIRASSGDYIVLLNNDTIVTRGWLSAMLKHCRSGDGRCMVGPVTNSIGNEAMIRLGYEDLRDMPKAAFAYCGAHMGETYPSVKMLALFCTMFPRRLVEDIGLLDENYGVGMFEDDDYSMAARRAGYRLILAEDAFVHHFGSATFKLLDDDKHRALFEKNRAYYENKWNTKWVMHKYRPEYMPDNG